MYSISLSLAYWKTVLPVFRATFSKAQYYESIILQQPEVTPRQMCGLELFWDDGGGVILMILLVRGSMKLHFVL